MKYTAVDSTKSPRYSGIKTFFRMESVRTVKDIDFAVVGIPFDTGASYRAGARFGPTAIREISSLLKTYNPELGVNIFDFCSGVDYGDIDTIPGCIEDTYDLIESQLSGLFGNDVIPIAMGGDHSITLGELRAAHKKYGAVSLLHFDSHYDTWPEYFGKPYNHGTPFKHAVDECLIDASRSIQVGIRGGLYSGKDAGISKGMGFEVLPATECRKIGPEEVVERIKRRVGGSKIFLSFDIDFLDPAYAPGTGTPEIGGFSTAQALDMIRGLKELDIIGYDVVEVSPPYDHSSITALAAANIIMEFMSHIAYKKKLAYEREGADGEAVKG